MSLIYRSVSKEKKGGMEGGTEEIRRSHHHQFPFFIVRDTTADISVALSLLSLLCLYCPLIPEPFSAHFTPNTESATQKSCDEKKERKEGRDFLRS